MSGTTNINKIRHSAMVLAIDAKITDYNTMANLEVIPCDGFNKLMVQYIISVDTWTSAGNIICYGAFKPTGTYTALDNTIENSNFAIVDTDDAKVGLGEIYIVENVPPWVKIGWDNTAAGSTGTISVWAVPFNS